jgi:hypothetical protein
MKQYRSGQLNQTELCSKEEDQMAKKHEKMLTIPGHKENANQNHTTIPPHLIEYPPSRTPPPTNVGKDAGKKERSYIAGGNVSYATTLENKRRLLKKLNIDLSYDPAIPLLGIYPKECDSGCYKGTCTPMFIAVTIAKLWQQPRCLTAKNGLRKCGIYTQWNFIQL